MATLGFEKKDPRVTITTKFGDIKIRFYPDEAPRHVENFINLAKIGFYNGTTFHRVVPGFIIQGGDPLSKSQDRTKVSGKAKPVGEWNSYELICKDGTAELIFNGQNVGKIRGCDPSAGYICLQSEGAEIHFRNIQIKELK